MRGLVRAYRVRDARDLDTDRSFARARGSRVTLASARHCAGLRPVPSLPAVTWGAQSAHPCARCACAASLPRTPRCARGLIHVTAAAARLVATAAARATREPRTRAKHLTAPARLARMKSFLNPQGRSTAGRVDRKSSSRDRRRTGAAICSCHCCTPPSRAGMCAVEPQGCSSGVSREELFLSARSAAR